MKYLFVFLSFIIGAISVWATIPRIVLISKKKRLFDNPNERSSHKRLVPRLGGIAFLPGVVLAFCLSMGIRLLMGYDIKIISSYSVAQEALFFICGIILLYGTGIIDDLKSVRFRNKFFIQILAACLLLFGGIYVNSMHGLFCIYEISSLLGYILTVILVVFVINAINLIDGVDGLASGLSGVALLVYGIWFLFNGLFVYAMMSFSMLGCLSVFFIYNVFGNRMKLFMGDTGSLVLGYLIAYLSAKFAMLNINPETYDIIGAPVLIFSVLFIPLFDVIRVFAVRLREGKSPFLPDRNHIHHKLLELGLTHRQTMCFLLTASIMFSYINFRLINYIGVNFMFLADMVCGITLMLILQWGINKRIVFQKKLNDQQTYSES